MNLTWYKKLLFPGMFERQDHWMLGVSSIKSRGPSMNKFTGLFWSLLRFSFLALPLSNAILLVEQEYKLL